MLVTNNMLLLGGDQTLKESPADSPETLTHRADEHLGRQVKAITTHSLARSLRSLARSIALRTCRRGIRFDRADAGYS